MRLAFDIKAAAAPTGATLVRITVDQQGVKAGYRAVLHGLGEGFISIHSDHADATAANFARQNYVEVYDTDASPEEFLGSFFLEEGDFSMLSSRERAGRILTFKGRGGLAILERAVLLHEPYDPDQPQRGGVVPDVPGMWAWEDEPYGGIMIRGIEEGQAEPGTPLADVTASFSRTNATNGPPWDNITSRFETPIGTTILELYADMVRSGLIVQMGEGLVVNAYDSRGTDRSSATFAAGKVRFEAGVNIAADLDRRISPRTQRSRMLIRGGDATYAIADYGAMFTPDVEQYGILDLPEISDPDVMMTYGERALRERNKMSDSCTFPHIPGDDELNGVYTPRDHYWLGDIVTVHTGTAEHDYNEFDVQVAAIGFWHDAAGNWFAQPELGAQYIEPGTQQFEERIAAEIRQNARPLELCRAITTVTTSFSSVGIRVTENTGGTVAAALPAAWQPGMIAVAHARYDGAGGLIPSPPTGWTAIGSGGASGTIGSVGQRGAWRLLQAGDENAGTWSQAHSVIVMTFDGMDTADPIGTIAGVTSGSGNITWPTMSLEKTDGTSRVLMIGVHNTEDISDNTVTGTQAVSLLAGAAGGKHAIWITDGVSAWGEHSITTNNDNRTGTVYELRTSEGTSVATAGDAHADLVGTGSKAARCGHAHHVLRAAAPTTGDDEDDGYPVGTAWLVVDDVDTPTTISAIYRLLDGTAGAAVWVQEPGGGAPTNVNYLVGTANGTLTNEIVVGTTPGGELGGTWASPTVDSTHSGSAHTDFIAKATVDAKGDLLAATADNTVARVAVGTNGKVLTADSTAAAGVSWQTPSGGITECSPLTNGDVGSPELIFANGDTISVCV